MDKFILKWGGHLDLRALLSALQKTIVIYSADGAPLPIKCNDDSGDDKSKEEDTDTGIDSEKRAYTMKNMTEKRQDQSFLCTAGNAN